MDSTGIEIKFGEVLKKLRKHQAINQVDLAANVELDRSAIANYERGHRLPSIEVLVDIAEFFGVSLDYLILGHSKDRLSKDSNNFINQELMAENVALMENLMMFQDSYATLQAEVKVLNGYIEAQKAYFKLLESK